MRILRNAWNLYRTDGLEAVFDRAHHKLTRGDWGPTFRGLVGDTLHQQLLMYKRLGYWPKVRNPRTFNEKVIHRKLYTDDDRFARVEDKWAVRDYVAERIGDHVLPDVHHVTDDPETIPFDSLPEEFVVKPTHLSGPVIIIDEDDTPDHQRIKQECLNWLDQVHGELKHEYWYQEIEPRILVEERLHGTDGVVPRDFKFFVFHGRVEFVEVDSDRHENHTRRFYNRDWTPQEFELLYPLGPEIKAPDHLEDMIAIAETLGSGFDFIRVDLYDAVGRGIVFGELTVAPGSGGEEFRPREYDFEFGELW
ncbi:hypothetical protein OB905_10885 [Halobacteria archaeon AArc-dxtr1]|nr:hypothetical protein [Halobacteria archaeon AArc-dxtr1]